MFLRQLNFVNWELCQHVSAHITVFHLGRYLWHGAARPLTIFCLTTCGVHGTLWGPISTKNSLDWFYKQSQDNSMSCIYILSKWIVNLTTVNPLYIYMGSPLNEGCLIMKRSSQPLSYLLVWHRNCCLHCIHGLLGSSVSHLSTQGPEKEKHIVYIPIKQIKYRKKYISKGLWFSNTTLLLWPFERLFNTPCHGQGASGLGPCSCNDVTYLCYGTAPIWWRHQQTGELGRTEGAIGTGDVVFTCR